MNKRQHKKAATRIAATIRAIYTPSSRQRRGHGYTVPQTEEALRRHPWVIGLAFCMAAEAAYPESA